ncbi:MAG: hypothetical protein JOZ21_08155 [Verrucomicrobia bacterium]|nr:hypothetical protein [Verrucomicrobiota bacterium]
MSGKMEGEDKSKKVAKEKRSVKKAKAVSLPIEEVPALAEPKKTTVRKSPSTRTAKSSVRSKRATEPSYEQVQLRAYFIGERRKSLGIQGDETSDWVQAERELKEELAGK